MTTSTTTGNTASGRAALVTGGSGGIGRATAERLAADGYGVALLFSGGRSRADEAVAAITATGGRAFAVRADVADEAQMAAAFDRVGQEYGGVDVVVNTAGIMLLAPVSELALADLDRMHRTNIRGTFVVSQLAARRLRGWRCPGELLDVGDPAAVARLRGLRGVEGGGRGDDADPGP